MRSLHPLRNALLLVLIAVACTGGTFTCHSGKDDGDKIDVNGKVNN